MGITNRFTSEEYVEEKLADLEASLSPIQSDWNQNDEISPDYIKNRPFYSTGEYENKELLKDFKPVGLGYGVYILKTCPVLIEGQTYQVILNNEEFICVGRINDEGSVALGNINYKTDGWTDEHEPFSLSSLGGMGILDVDAENASTEYTISISEAIEKIQPLDKKYIADYLVGEKTEGKEFVYKDKTYIGGAGSEIFNSPANKAIGSFSHAEGADTVALGNNSHAEGVSTKALADESHAEGDTSYAEGKSSHAEGYFTQTFGEASHSEGIHTIASGDYSHAEGENTVANSQGSHVQGRFNLLDDMPKYTYSYFIGNAQRDGEEKVYILNNTPVLNAEVGTFDAEITETQVKNLKTNDLVIFSNQKPFDIYYNITEIQSDDNSQYQLALTGITTQINRGPGTYAHIVGNGTSEENRSNAHTLDWEGNAWFAGDVRIGGTNYANATTLATQNDVNNINSLIKPLQAPDEENIFETTSDEIKAIFN